jgi:hypothetical protein
MPPDSRDRLVGVGVEEALGQLRQHRAGDGVHPLGPIQRDGRDVVGDRIEDVGLGLGGGLGGGGHRALLCASLV